jgi:hypothetical protein
VRAPSGRRLHLHTQAPMAYHTPAGQAAAVTQKCMSGVLPHAAAGLLRKSAVHANPLQHSAPLHLCRAARADITHLTCARRTRSGSASSTSTGSRLLKYHLRTCCVSCVAVLGVARGRHDGASGHALCPRVQTTTPGCM